MPNSIQDEVIELFIHFARLLNQPRSVGAIYGLLFCSPEPMTLDDIQTRLAISRGGASMGLKFLREIGAIREVRNNQDRRLHYEAEIQVRRVLRNLLRDHLQPEIEQGRKRLASLRSTLDQSNADPYLKRRLDHLQNWGRRANQLLPVLKAILGP